MENVMKTYASTDLKQSLGDVLAVANVEPVSITKHKKPRYVLMSIEAYETRFAPDPRKAFAIEDMPAEHLAMLENALNTNLQDEP
jgi:prevent-host-death family protein